MTQLLVVNGSCRENGVIDSAVKVAVETASEAGATIEVIYLRDFPIEFYRNCRQCTQVPGEAPGACIQQDCMHELVDKIEAADGYILPPRLISISPTNFYSIIAVFKRFMERLIVYAYQPWGSHAPKLRKKSATKRAMLIASSAAPGLMGRFFYGTLKQLKVTEQIIGARPVGSVFVGPMFQQERPALPGKAQNRVRAIVIASHSYS